MIINNGVKEWWVEVKVGSGRTGSVLAGKSTSDKHWDSGNFGDLDNVMSGVTTGAKSRLHQ